MSRQYAPKAFLRHVPFDLLREFSDGQGIPIAVDWAAVPDGDVEPVYEAWLNLPPDARDRAEKMFREVFDLASPAGIRQIVSEAQYQGHGVTGELERIESYHGKALWTLLHHPVVFHNVHRVQHTEDLPARYWFTLTGLPAVELAPPHSEAHELQLALAEYFRSEQGRGQRVTVEHYLRAGTDHYYFCYPDDYTQTLVSHDQFGKLRRVARRPAFELVFVYAPASGTLDIFAPGDKWVRSALEEVFCHSVLGCDPPLERPARSAFELNGLLDRGFQFPTDPADGVKEVRVRRLRLALPDRGQRLTLEVDTLGRPEAMNVLLDSLLDPVKHPRHRLNVTLATFAIRYAGGGRERVLSFDVSFAAALGESADVTERVPGRVWKLGPFRAAGRGWIGFLVTGLHRADAAVVTEKIPELGSAGAVVFAAADPPTDLGRWPVRPRVVVLTDVASGGPDGLVIDHAVLNGLLLSSGGAVPEPVPVAPLPPGASWSEVELVVEDRHVWVRWQGAERRVGYEEAGFADRKTGKPNQHWALLTRLARRGGVLEAEGGRRRTNSAALKAAVSGLRKRLRMLTGLSSDPIYLTGRGGGYQAGFRIRAAGCLSANLPTGVGWDDVSLTLTHEAIVVGFSAAEVGAAYVGADSGSGGGWDATVGETTKRVRVALAELGLNPAGLGALEDLVAGRGRVRRPSSDRGMRALSTSLRLLLPDAGDPFTRTDGLWVTRFEVTPDRR